MKKQAIIVLLAFLAIVFGFAATVNVRPGKDIKDYPNNGNPSTNARYIMEKGDFTTNENISHLQLMFVVTNSLTASLNSKASTGTVTIASNFFFTYITNTSNFLYSTSFFAGSNLVKVISGTNTLVEMTSTNGTNFYKVNADDSVANAIISNALVNFTITTSNFLASSNAFFGSNLVVVLPATNTTVVMTSTNGTNFYAVSSSGTDSGTISTNLGLNTNSGIFSVQYEPNRGSLWYSGTNGIPKTNEARAGMEFNPFWRSLRMGEVAGSTLDVLNVVGRGSNSWNNTNIGVCTVGFGSNAWVKAAFASVLGGGFNAILSNSVYSTIAGGKDNLIETNVHTSFIGAGSENSIRAFDYGEGFVGDAVIVGGTNNRITGIGRGAFIGAGEGNTLSGSNSVIVGGKNNIINDTNSSGNVIVGGESHIIGTAAASRSSYVFIGGGFNHQIDATADYSVIAGGRDHIIADGCSNSVIVGGAFNQIGVSGFLTFGSILGGERNLIDGSYGFVIGTSNRVGTSIENNLGTIGFNLTNNHSFSIDIGVTNQNKMKIDREFASLSNIILRLPQESFYTNKLAGAGNGNTNYTLLSGHRKAYLGSSNVNIVAIMGTVPNEVRYNSISVTNLSADTWGITFSSATNRWRFYNAAYGTNQPLVLTNNTELLLDMEVNNTNVTVRYNYFTPGL